MGECKAPGGILARRSAPEKAASQAQRDRDYGRSKVVLVLVAVQAHARTRLIAVDQAGVGRKTRIAGQRRSPGGLLAQKSRDGRPGPAGLRIDSAVAIALQIRNPTPAAGVGDRHRHELATGHLHGAKRCPCLQGPHLGHPALLLGCRKPPQQHGSVINDLGGQGVVRKQRKRHCNAIIGPVGGCPSQPPASA
ncbi:hypothetical protein SDC9_149074 [bioreactor metagenome]|uniref:Uncharacterized protein n=1 Tax=bioreactor metagenome TaxID=1076179 RepID=A0A645EKS6_9ZZZZ